MTDSWRWPGWTPDITTLVSKTEVPEAGGWIYRFRTDSNFTHVFVPDLALWAETIAESIARPKNTPVSVFSNLTAARDIKQPVPNH